MNRHSKSAIFARIGLLLLALCFVASDAEANITYGPWYPAKCRDARPTGFGAPTAPSVGNSGAQQCQYCRDVKQCTWFSNARIWRCFIGRRDCDYTWRYAPPNY